VIERLKTAFVDNRLTREDLDVRVGRVLASRTRADLAAVTADIPAGPRTSQQSTRQQSTGQQSTGQQSTGQAGAGRVGMAVAVAAAMTVVLTLATSIPPFFLLLVSCYFTAMIAAGAWILSSRHGKHAG
jgi:hypothetical protein